MQTSYWKRELAFERNSRTFTKEMWFVTNFLDTFHSSVKQCKTILPFVETTSNVTAVTEVWSASARLCASTWRPLVSLITTLYYVGIIFHCRVWYRALSLRVFTKIKVPASSLSPRLCAKFCFFCGLHCWVRPRTKIVYSIAHSFYLMPWETKHLRCGITKMIYWYKDWHQSNC